MRKRILASLAAATVALGLAAGPSGASTGGTEDRENVYDAVAFLIYYADGGRYSCSATLIDEDVLLTAAHCTDGVDGKVGVSFEPVIAEEGPFPIPHVADREAGYTAKYLASYGFSAGEARTHPGYSHFTDLANWNDTGVVVLDKPVRGVEPMPVAGLGTLDEIPQSQLGSTLFRAVGYGTEVRQADEGPRNPTPQGYPLVRRWVDMPGQKLDDQVLQTNGNDKDPFGTGGTCFGDSGGPLLLENAAGVEEIVGVTSYGYTSNCRYLDGYQRMDIAASQDWLAGFLD